MLINLTAMFMGVLATTAPPSAPPQQYDTGYASAYAHGVMESTVRYRLDNNLWRVPLVYDWYAVSGYVANNDCSRVGEVTTLLDPSGAAHRVLIADCGGDDGGANWMTENNIIVELDAKMWQRLTDKFGKPLAVQLKR